MPPNREPLLKTIGERKRTVKVIGFALWICGLAICVWLWNYFQSAEAIAGTPDALLRAASWLGGVVYDDPDLAMRIRISRLALLWTLLCAAAWMITERSRVAASISDFFRQPSHPLNLAVFRIVVFSQIYSLLWFEFVKLIGALPNGLQYPPLTGVPDVGVLSRFAHWPPHTLTPEQIGWAGAALTVVCITGMIGLFSRMSALAAAFLMFVGWGAIQWYGKVDHHHHLVWFSLLLAASPCGDALAVDALIQSWRRARRGTTAPPGPARRYGLPLGLAMLLLGVAYFFPGFWKYWRSGLDWAFSDNPTNTMHLFWHITGGPKGVRLDQAPALLQWGSLSVMVFEMAFLFLLFQPRSRRLAAISGLTFHGVSRITGRTGFPTLAACYVMFLDWDRILRWVGARVFPRLLRFCWTDISRVERGFVSTARTFDLLQRIEWADRSKDPSPERGVADPAAPVEATVESRTSTGYEAYLAVVWRVPLLWPFLPPLFLLAISRRVREWFRPCMLPDAVRLPTALASEQAARRREVPLATVLAGGLLLAGNVHLGAVRGMNGWPLACYPLFDGLNGDSYQTLRIIVVAESGAEREIVPSDYRETFGNRWSQLLLRILGNRDEARKREQLRLVWSVISGRDPELAQGSLVRFLTVTSRLDLEHWNDPPGNPEVLFEMPLTPPDTVQN